MWLSFPSRPTMRLVASELFTALTGVHREHDRFRLARLVKAELAARSTIIVCDEAQNLNRECIEFLRHLGEDENRRSAILLVGRRRLLGGASREPMLWSRVYRRVSFRPLLPNEVFGVVRRFHPLYHDASDDLIGFVDAYCGHGNFRNWASFTLTAVGLCEETGRHLLDEQVARNAFALLGGGVGAT